MAKDHKHSAGTVLDVSGSLRIPVRKSGGRIAHIAQIQRVRIGGSCTYPHILELGVGTGKHSEAPICGIVTQLSLDTDL